MDEASGNLIDAHTGGRTFTVTNAPTATTGKINGCRVFASGSAQYASRADEAALEPGAAFTFATWIYQPGSIASDQDIWNKWGGGGGPILETNNDGGGNLKMFHTSSDSDKISTSGLGMVADTWYHVIVRYDGSAGTDALRMRIRVNGSDQTLTFAGAAVGSSFADNAVAHYMCYWPTLGRFGNFRLDQTAFWQQTLSDADCDAIYNSGSGLAYSSWDAAGASVKLLTLLGVG